MEVILLERIGKLGQMGDVVRVKDGFARNFLLPRGKALARDRRQQVALRRHEGRVAGAQSRAQGRRREGRRQARRQDLRGDPAGVRNRPAVRLGLDRATSPALLNADGADVNRTQVALNAPIKTIGQYKVPLALHPEVEIIVTVIVARSADEAERIARGEDVTVRRDQAEEEAAAALAAAEDFFEPEAAKALREGDEEPEADAEATGEASAEENKPAKKAKSKKNNTETAASSE